MIADRIAAYWLFRHELGFTRKQARALADAGYVVVGWVQR